MHIVVQREASEAGATLGKLFINGAPFCDTLEDEIREIPGEDVALWKKYGMTAIPAGIYEVTLEDSPHFGPDTMTVNGVHGFDKIRIHAGNTAEDTHGCLLVGVRNSEYTIGSSRITLAELKALVIDEIAAERTVLIEYKNPPVTV